jgi:2Fe-2S ferredoxin
MSAGSAETIELTYVDNMGVARSVAATVGESLMQVATFHGIAGIDADCGGSCACGTCRVYLDGQLAGQVPSAEEDELGVIDFVTEEANGVRLGCQITVTPAFAGATITVGTDD